jgi:hypothetical protein
MTRRDDALVGPVDGLHRRVEHQVDPVLGVVASMGRR